MATKVGEIYYCRVCGNRVKIVRAGSGTLVCCNLKMEVSH